MMWNGDGSWGWWWLALPLMIMCIIMMGRMMGHGHRQGSHGTHGGEPAGQGSGAKRILAERLARGEIDIAEYERRLAVLQPTNEVDRTHGGVRHVG
jgi:putative membrane protein